jgi:hypothetical protein
MPEIVDFSLGRGEDMNLRTVELMREIVKLRRHHPGLRELALTVLRQAGVPSQDYLREAIALGTFVQNAVTYRKDTAGVEQLYDPVMMVQRMDRGAAEGDCDDHALLLATLLVAIGHTPFFRIVRYNKGSPSYNHIYVVDYVAVKDKTGKARRFRIPLDTIFKLPKIMGYEVRHDEGREIPAV